MTLPLEAHVTMSPTLTVVEQLEPELQKKKSSIVTVASAADAEPASEKNAGPARTASASRTMAGRSGDFMRGSLL
jgi:hypothetical protein